MSVYLTTEGIERVVGGEIPAELLEALKSQVMPVSDDVMVAV